MERNQKPSKVFSFRVSSTDKLTDEQFRILVRKYLCMECDGLMCEMCSDWSRDKGMFWDTQTWTLDSPMSPSPNQVEDGLIHFANRGLCEMGLNPTNLPLSEFLSFKGVYVVLRR